MKTRKPRGTELPAETRSTSPAENPDLDPAVETRSTSPVVNHDLDPAVESRRLREASVAEVLTWAAERFPDAVAFATSLGLEDQVVIDALARSGLAIPVFTLDTGRLFPETYDLLERTETRYDLRIRVMAPEGHALERMVASHGVNLFRSSVAWRRECCRVRKIEPLRRALAGLSAWVTGLRQEQAPTRQSVAIVEWDAANGLVKINPLAHWSAADVRTYIETHRPPCNPLHDHGYPSIGCACCTRAVAPGEDERAGRWWWESAEKKECGLHPGRRPTETKPEAAP